MPVIPEQENTLKRSYKVSTVNQNAFSVKLIGGASALILVAAIGGYMIFGGEDVTDESHRPANVEINSVTMPQATEIAEIISPDEETDSSVKASGVDDPGTAEPASLQTLDEMDTQLAQRDVQSSGALGSTGKTVRGTLVEDKPTILVPIETPMNNTPLKPLEPQMPVWGVHVVSRGDTLWHLANRYLNNPFRYVELANWSDIKNPDRIYPGDNVKYKDESKK